MATCSLPPRNIGQSRKHKRQKKQKKNTHTKKISEATQCHTHSNTHTRVAVLGTLGKAASSALQRRLCARLGLEGAFHGRFDCRIIAGCRHNVLSFGHTMQQSVSAGLGHDGPLPSSAANQPVKSEKEQEDSEAMWPIWRGGEVSLSAS